MSAFNEVVVAGTTLIMVGENPLIMRGLPCVLPSEGCKLKSHDRARLNDAAAAMWRGDLKEAGKLISQVERSIGTPMELQIAATRHLAPVPGPQPKRFVEPLSVRAKKAGRPPHDGDRHNCGKLKPPKPNPKVVALRRELLGAAVGEEVDITKAENALDVALARGWISGDQRKAADGYAVLLRRVLTKMPRYRAPRALSDLKVHSQLRPSEVGQSRSGVLTDEDGALVLAAADLEADRITLAEYQRIEIAHRRRKIDWSRLPKEDFGRIWDAMADSTPAGPVRKAKVDLDTALSATEDADASFEHARARLLADLELLRGLWEALTEAECRELMSVCVLSEWPGWMTMQFAARPVTRDQHRRWSDLQNGLDKVFDAMTVQEQAEPSPQPPKLRPVVRHEHFTYVDEDGAVLFEVERKVRA